jgi:hypothetical protein
MYNQLVFDPYFYFNPLNIKFVKWKNIITKNSGLLLFPCSSLSDLPFEDLISNFIVNFYDVEMHKKIDELHNLISNSRSLSLFSIQDHFARIHNKVLDYLQTEIKKYNSFSDFYEKTNKHELYSEFIGLCDNYIKQFKPDKNIHFTDLFYITSPKYRKLGGLIDDLKMLSFGSEKSYRKVIIPTINYIIDNNEKAGLYPFFTSMIKNIPIKDYKYRHKHLIGPYELLLFMIRSSNENSYLSGPDYKQLEQLAFIKYKYFILLNVKKFSSSSWGEYCIVDYFASLIEIFNFLSDKDVVLKSATLFIHHSYLDTGLTIKVVSSILNTMIKAFDRSISLTSVSDKYHIENLTDSVLYLEYYLPNFGDFTIMITEKIKSYNACIFSNDIKKIMIMNNLLKSKNSKEYIDECSDIYSCELISIHDTCRDFNFQFDFPQ